MGNQIYKEISKFAEMQRDEIKREKTKKKRKSVCIDPDSVIGKEIMYQTALLHEILDEIRGGKNLPLEKLGIIDARKQRDDVNVCITLAIPGETEKTEITHTKKAISVSAPKISLEFDKLSRQS